MDTYLKCFFFFLFLYFSVFSTDAQKFRFSNNHCSCSITKLLVSCDLIFHLFKYFIMPPFAYFMNHWFNNKNVLFNLYIFFLFSQFLSVIEFSFYSIIVREHIRYALKSIKEPNENAEVGKCKKMKNSWEETNSRFEMVKERIHKLEDRSVEIVSLRNRKRKESKNKKLTEPQRHMGHHQPYECTQSYWAWFSLGVISR